MGTVLGSVIWGWLGDRIGAAGVDFLLAGVLFIATSICGSMPHFGWNVAMCFVMGLGVGGMLPITFALMAEVIPARHRGWLMVLVGGEVAGAYILTSWLAAELTPTYSWRILWLLGLPTVLGAQLAKADPGWLDGIEVVATDLVESSRAGLSSHLDHARRVADPFHVVRAANGQRATPGAEGDAGPSRTKRDPLYPVAADEVFGAWLAKESVRDVYLAEDRNEAALLLDKAIAGCPIRLEVDLPRVGQLEGSPGIGRRPALHDVHALGGPGRRHSRHFWRDPLVADGTTIELAPASVEVALASLETVWAEVAVVARGRRR